MRPLPKISKKDWLLASAVFAGALFFSFYSLHLIRTVPAMLTQPVSSAPVIVIDAGHGGMDGGAVGVDGIVEKDINLSIALVLRDLFEVNGYDVVMTRETDCSIHDESAKSVKQQKTSDLRNRLKLVNENPNAIFLCIHQNKFGVEKYHGAQMFYSPNDESSKLLAQMIQRNITEMLQPDNTREIKKAGKDLYLMTQAKVPSVLIECGFLSNAQEAHKLSTPEYQQQLAFSIFSSVMEFQGNRMDVSA